MPGRSGAGSLDCQETVEERPIPPESLTKIFRRPPVAAVSRVFQPGPLVRKCLLEGGHHLDHEFCRVLHGLPGLVHEACLDGVPALPEAATFLASEERLDVCEIGPGEGLLTILATVVEGRL